MNLEYYTHNQTTSSAFARLTSFQYVLQNKKDKLLKKTDYLTKCQQLCTMELGYFNIKKKFGRKARQRLFIRR
jgi:hypothetical protein